MKLILLGILITPLTYAVVPQSAIDMITRQEHYLQTDRFEAKVGCSAEDTPHCDSESKAKHDRWAEAVNKMSSGVCMLRPDEQVNSSGVSNQWECLTKYQEIREGFWKRNHEEFFERNKLIPSDYFEIKKKYPKAVLGPVTSYIEQLLFIDYKCGKFNFECATHFAIIVDQIIYSLPDIVCANAATKNRTRGIAERFQANEEASQQCLDFAYEVMAKGFKKAESEKIAVDSIPNAAVETWYKPNSTNQNGLKHQFLTLKNIAGSFKDEKRFSGSPLAIVYNRIMTRFAAQIKTLDAAFDVSWSRVDDVPKIDLATLPIEPVVIPVGQITPPDARLIGIRTSANVIDESFTINGNYLAPATSWIMAKNAIGEEKLKACYQQFKNSKPVIIPIAIELTNQGAAPITATSAPISQYSLLPTAVEKPVDTRLLELAQQQSKIELLIAVNCTDTSDSQSCQAYRMLLNQSIPNQLSLICKNDECIAGYKAMQLTAKQDILAGLTSDVANLRVENAVVDPLKASEALVQESNDQAAYEKTVKPYVLKLSPQTGSQLARPANSRFKRTLCGNAITDVNCSTVAEKLSEKVKQGSLPVARRGSPSKTMNHFKLDLGQP